MKDPKSGHNFDHHPYDSLITPHQALSAGFGFGGHVRLRGFQPHLHVMGGCQNYGPLLGPLHTNKDPTGDHNFYNHPLYLEGQWPTTILNWTEYGYIRNILRFSQRSSDSMSSRNAVCFSPSMMGVPDRISSCSPIDPGHLSAD